MLQFNVHVVKTLPPNGIVLSLLLLLYLSGSIQPWYLADGKKKRNTPPSHTKEKLGQFPGTSAEPVKEEGGAAVVQSLIGSRPPNCDGRCKGCWRPCMAVQVPVTPQQFRIQRSRATNSLEYSRGDDISNYKPMTWKCRCGEIYFNP